MPNSDIIRSTNSTNISIEESEYKILIALYISIMYIIFVGCRISSENPMVSKNWQVLTISNAY